MTPALPLEPYRLVQHSPSSLSLLQAAYAHETSFSFAAHNTSCRLRWAPPERLLDAALSAPKLRLNLVVAGEALVVTLANTEGLSLFLRAEPRRVPEWLLGPMVFDGLLRPLFARVFDADAALDTAQAEVPPAHACELHARVDFDAARLALTLSMGPRLTQRFALALQTQAPLAAAGRSLDHLPSALPLRLAGPRVPLSDLRTLGAGDVIVLPGCRGRGWVGEWRPLAGPAQRCVLDHSFTQLKPSPGTPMDKPHDEEQGEHDHHGHHEAHAAAGNTLADPLAGLPVQLSFSLGSQQVTLARLRSVQAGYVFALEQTVLGATVGLQANGEAFGTGELVALGDKLGVRLLSVQSAPA
jgi:type III secretion system YscQ/HrcQ family protein